MVDRVLFQTDDALSEQNLAEQRARKNSTDYVERGLTLDPNWTTNTVNIAAGHAAIRADSRAYDLFSDARSGVSLPTTSGTTHLYLTFDPANQDDISYHLDTDDSPPLTPSLKIGELDGSAQTVVELNRAPTATFDDVTASTVTTGSVTTRGSRWVDPEGQVFSLTPELFDGYPGKGLIFQGPNGQRGDFIVLRDREEGVVGIGFQNAQTGEFTEALKMDGGLNPDSINSIGLENDMEDGILELETNQGGGIIMRTGDSQQNKRDRVVVPDGDDVIKPRFENLDGFDVRAAAGVNFDYNLQRTGEEGDISINFRDETGTAKFRLVYAENGVFRLVDTEGGGEVLRATGDGLLTLDSATKYSQQDLTSGSVTPGERGVVAAHDGTGSAAAGLYESDPDNQRWVGFGLASGNTIPY
jgi:hypothetical protein